MNLAYSHRLLINQITALTPLGELSERAQHAGDTKGNCASFNKGLLHGRTSVTAIDLSYVCWLVPFQIGSPMASVVRPPIFAFLLFFSIKGWGVVQLSGAFAAFLHFIAPGRQPGFLSCKEKKGSRNKYLFPCFIP